MNAKKNTPKSTEDSGYTGLTGDERAAMKERTKELKAETRSSSRKGKADGESEVLAKIAGMPESDRVLAERIHEIVKTNAPDLSPRTYYGMPAYANKAGKVVCFFQDAGKFKSRYATFGFNDDANLDEGTMWATSFAVTKLTAANEAKIAALVKKALS